MQRVALHVKSLLKILREHRYLTESMQITL